jgi:thiol:disulfide interchange protein DsbC
MMKKILLSVVACAMIIWCAGAAAAATAAKAETDVAKTLKTTFPDITYDSISPSPVKGLYEVVAEDRIFYFAPKDGILIVGQMFDKTKRNLTGERLQTLTNKVYESIVKKAKDLPLDKAVKTGSGKHVVIEFTDPDCPFCRQAAKFFESRTDVTKYTFFTPLPMHPDAHNKERYILCQQDKSKAMNEVMNGKMDNQKYETCSTAEVDELIKAHDSAGAKMKVSSTPFFIIDGKVVSGADIPKIETLLKEKVGDGKDKK